MTAEKILSALPIVQKLVGLQLPVKKAYKVYSLAKQINEQREFFINEEKKLIEKFNGTIQEDGQIIFENDVCSEDFAKAHFEMMTNEIDGFSPIELTFEDLKGAEFSPFDIGLLDGLVNFID